jgi:2-phosphosulfolactate phosphatase
MESIIKTGTTMSNQTRPSLYTCASPALLNLYELTGSVVVIIDVFRATSTIATALHNGAKAVIPVDSVAECIRIGKQIDGITAGERDGKIAEGLAYGNSPFEYPRSFVDNKLLVLTTTNGTRLLHMALDRNAPSIITGSFPNLDAVCDYLQHAGMNVVLGCAAWKDKVNLEDLLFAGAVIARIKNGFHINCDTSQIAETLYEKAKKDLFKFLKDKNASHYHRLHGFGLDEDMRYCLTSGSANVLPLYTGGRLIAHR